MQFNIGDNALVVVVVVVVVVVTINVPVPFLHLWNLRDFYENTNFLVQKY